MIAIVGESGCGKSTFARVIVGLHGAYTGSISLDGTQVKRLVRNRLKSEQQALQMIFQSPDQSLNPEQRVKRAIGRPLEFYHHMNSKERAHRIDELLEMVGLQANHANRFPAELSGGEKQRVSIARAFAAEPRVLLCDEIIASLDTVTAKRIMDLLKELQTTTGVSCIFITHDLTTVATSADRVMVLYGGRVAGTRR